MSTSYAIAFVFTPLLAVGLGWLAVLLHERSLAKAERRSRASERRLQALTPSSAGFVGGSGASAKCPSPHRGYLIAMIGR